MNDLYQRIQLREEEADCAEIIGILSSIKKGKRDNDIKLLNYFKEIPVSYGANILTVEKNSVEFQVHQLQAVVMAEERVTILKSAAFPRDVLANVTYVNVGKSKIVLSRFSYAVVRADRRMSVRVELTDPIYATFESPGGQVSGRLHDMSVTGVAINVPEEPEIALSELGNLTVILPIGTLSLPATLLKVTPQLGGFRLAFLIEANHDTEKHISRYVFQRQVEIIKELKDHPGLK